MKFAAFLLLIFAIAGISRAQDPASTPAPIIAEIYLAKPDTDGKAGEAAEHFLVTDIPIFCVVRLHAPGVASVRMELFATGVPGVKSNRPVVSTSYTTKENEDRVNFTGRPHGLWVAGKYRVDVFVGDKKVRNIEFEIKPSTAEAERPSLKPGRKPAKKSVSSEEVSQQSSVRTMF